MTYGFGLWRSGYTTLIPWHWCWPNEPDPFNYLRGRFSGCGQRMDDEGEVIPAIYWMCFREGYDDERYLYTLQQAIVRRTGSNDPACLSELKEARQLLQEIWDAISVQPRYLADGMWPSEEFDTIRWRLASATERLLKFPVTNPTAVAESVLVNSAPRPKSGPKESSPYDFSARTGALVRFDLANDFTDWKNGTAEGKAEVTEAARHEGNTGLRWTVVVDHLHDGGEGGKYPVGWPRLAREFKPGELDLTSYDTLELWVRTDSNRDEVSDDHTPIGLVISSHGKNRSLYSTTTDLGDQQRTWIPLRFPLKQMIAAADAGADPWKSISRIQLFLSEHDYPHQTRFVLDIGEVFLLHLDVPVISAVEAPRHILLPRRALPFAYEISGSRSVTNDSYTITAALEDSARSVRAEAQQGLRRPPYLALRLPSLDPGSYRLRLTIRDAAGRSCSELAQPVNAHAGPLAAVE